MEMGMKAPAQAACAISEPQPTAAPMGGQTLRRVRRWTGYAMWSTAAFALPVALERLILCPVLRHYLGGVRFGAFVWVLDVMNLLSMAATAGFSNYLLRSLATVDGDRSRAMLRMSLLLAVAIVLPVLVAGSVVSFQLAESNVRQTPFALYGPLAVLALFRALGGILISPLRIKRRFATIFALKAIEGALLVTALLFAGWQNVALVGAVYIVSAVVPLSLNAYMSREDIGRGAWWNPGLTKVMLVAWIGLAVPALIEYSLAYSPRIFLLPMKGAAAATVLYAATSIGNVFVTPVGLAGGLVMSLLASKSEFVLAGRRGCLYLATAFGCALLVGAVSYLAGIPIIHWLYPQDAAQAVTFYGWVALANTATAGIVLIRPVALKYARIRNVAGLSLITLLLQWAALPVLIPSYGPAGAAAALAFSALIALILWLGCFALLMRNPAAAAANIGVAVTESSL